MGRGLILLGCVAALSLFAFAEADLAHAQSSLGIGTNEPAMPSGGLFASWMVWINAEQQRFYRLLTGALKSIRDGGGGFWLLVGLSFLYGVFHAAGPGHGKAVISSYMIANEVALRRGVMLSFVSAMLQAATAIVLMTAVFLVLRGTAISMTDAAFFLERASYAMIAAFGAWLLWRKAAPVFRRAPQRTALAAAGATGTMTVPVDAPDRHAHDTAGQLHSHPHDHRHDHDHAAGLEHGHAHGHDHDHCGHDHAPDPGLLSGDRFEWRTAWAAIVAVGIRPCTGALIVLSFAFLNGLWTGGIVSVVAMGLGTAITVSALAILAVTAKNWALAIAGGESRAAWLHSAIEIAGAAFVLLLGLALFSASLSA